MMFTALRRTLLTTVLMALPLTAGAQTSRYESWSPPGGTSTQSAAGSENLLKDLKVLVDEAEKARAADSLFLRDLRDLMARYERPWTERLVFDDFGDGDFIKNPTWTSVSGEFWVEQGYGLRSKSVAGSAAAASEPGNGKVSKEQLALSILGAVLQGANKNTTTATTAPQPTAKAEPAVLSTRARISNAFALTANFSSWKEEGSFAYALTQGTGSSGYRLVYTPKQPARGATLDLVRVTTRGQGTIDSISIDTLEDKKNHSLEWTRAKDGQMAVSLDGKKVLSARDTSFRDPFDAVAIINAGADVIVKSVEVLGMR